MNWSPGTRAPGLLLPLHTVRDSGERGYARRARTKLSKELQPARNCSTRTAQPAATTAADAARKSRAVESMRLLRVTSRAARRARARVLDGSGDSRAGVRRRLGASRGWPARRPAADREREFGNGFMSATGRLVVIDGAINTGGGGRVAGMFRMMRTNSSDGARGGDGAVGGGGAAGASVSGGRGFLRSAGASRYREAVVPVAGRGRAGTPIPG